MEISTLTKESDMRSIRITIACITIILLMFGVVMVYSSSAINAGYNYGDDLLFLKKHLIFLVIGFVLSFLVMSMDLEDIRKNSRLIMFFSLVLLAIVLLPKIGREAGGAKRWINLYFFNLQPSEIAKIAIVVYLADFINRKLKTIEDFFKGFLPPFMVLGMTMGLIIIEPDLGTTITVGIIGLLMLYIAGAKGKQILATILLSLPLVYYLVFSVPYRRKRMLAFLNPWLDERGSGFQIVQSFVALGSGGLFGVGLGQSKQKLFFLPASHTDFIFSIIGEELGFLGASCIVILFFILIWQCILAALKVENIFRKMLITGIVLLIAFEVIVNVGVSSGFLPTKGLPLPFISYGGTSLIMHMVAIALLLNATRE